MLFPQEYLNAPRSGAPGLTNRQHHEKVSGERSSSQFCVARA
jgi:hypothetical protein